MEDEDSVYEAIVSKKRDRDNVMSEMTDSIKLITPEIVKAFMDYVKAEIVAQCDNLNNIKFEIEIADLDDCFIHPDNTSPMFEPLIVATKNAKRAFGFKSITYDKKFYQVFIDTVHEYLEVLIKAWNQKHHKVRIRSEFCDEDKRAYLKNK